MQNEIPIQSFDLVKRATIRVADTTEESGRVTADEVNLDRFHNRIRKEAISSNWISVFDKLLFKSL